MSWELGIGIAGVILGAVAVAVAVYAVTDSRKNTAILKSQANAYMRKLSDPEPNNAVPFEDKKGHTHLGFSRSLATENVPIAPGEVSADVISGKVETDPSPS